MYQLVSEKPSSWWMAPYREGFPLGNGRTGALVYGGAVRERICLTHARCWRGGECTPIPAVADALEEAREKILNGDALDGSDVLSRTLHERGYREAVKVLVPMADLVIITPAEEGAYAYERTLNLSDAVTTVRYADAGRRYSRRAFVSRADDVLVVELSSEADLSGVEVRLEKHPQEGTNPAEGPKVLESATDGSFSGIALAFDTGEPFGAAARVVREKHRITILVKVFPDGDPGRELARLSEALAALPADAETLLRRHLPAHRELFDRAAFRLGEGEKTASIEALLAAAERTGACPDELTELMWAYGRYLLISATRVGGLPCALLGLWCGEYNANWTFNMANINLQMIYWQTVGGDLAELMLPVFDYYDAQLPVMRECAKKIFGCRGIWLCAVTSPGSSGIPCAMSHILNWTGGAAWVSRIYVDYWLMTRDETFLRERLLPFLTETARFYEDFVCWKDGKWYVAPSVSPENQPETYRGQKVGYAQGCANATMDFALIRELFATLRALLPLVGGDGELEALCGRMLSGAPDYQTDPDGSAREWNHPDFETNDHHRHQSHVYPVFPGSELARCEGREPFRKALEKRLRVGISDQTSWSLVNMSMAFSRLNDGEKALRCLGLISRAMLMGNLFTVHNDWRGSGIGLEMDWAPFQIDANVGWSAAVQEMLAYSAEGRLDLCPALPKSWKTGAFRGLTTRCGLRAELEWTETEVTCELTALRDGETDVYAGERFLKRTALKRGERETLRFAR